MLAPLAYGQTTIEKSSLPFCDTLDKTKATETREDPLAQDTEPASQPVSANAAAPMDLESRLRALEEAQRELKAMRHELSDIKNEQKNQGTWLDRLKPLEGRFGGFVDVGAFYVQGDGTALRYDLGHALFPRYGYIPDSWVFYGDPLGTQINSRGDPADTGPSRAIKINDIANNSINFSVFAALGKTLTVNASIDFLVRSRNASQPGVAFNDFVDIRFAYGEYIVPIDAFALSLFAGKFDPVFGMEYRAQDSPDRLTVTPSLICRYTCGRTTGLKARARFFDDIVNVALSMTNNSSFTEYFPFGNEIAYQNLKTFQGRLGVVIPVGSGWEFGTSGSIGAQNFQPDNKVLQWQFGVDTRLNVRGFEFTAEFVKGKADGKTNAGSAIAFDAAPLLDYMGAYGLVGYRITNWFEPYFRTDWRQATHVDGVNFAYITRELRVTGGARFEIGEHVIFKAEYSHTWQLRLPQFPSDVATGSLVFRY
jgi:hypothetical protein